MRGGGAPKGAKTAALARRGAHPAGVRSPSGAPPWRFLIRVRLLPPSAIAPKAVARAPRGRAVVPDSRFHGPPESTVASRGRRTPNLAPYSGSPLETAPHERDPTILVQLHRDVNAYLLFVSTRSRGLGNPP